ncbi:MAG: hypothetical protein KAQ68_09680, partial [Clostridiales bacterium]|nr:hypothetical protein [Clostridiales bacterium]
KIYWTTQYAMQKQISQSHSKRTCLQFLMIENLSRKIYFLRYSVHTKKVQMVSLDWDYLLFAELLSYLATKYQLQIPMMEYISRYQSRY